MGGTMYLVCRHIKPNGLRCKSPAMKGHAFCYFHAKAHGATRIGVMDNIILPVTENPAAVQLAVSQTLQAMLASRISLKQCGLMLYGLAVGASTHKRKPEPLTDPVLIPTQSVEGDDLAPALCIDDGGVEHTDCSTCPNRDKCPRLLEDGSEVMKANSEAPREAPQPSTSEPRPPEPQSGEPRPAEAQHVEPRPAEAQPEEARSGEAQPANASPGETQPGETQSSETRPGVAQSAPVPITTAASTAKSKSNYHTGRVRPDPKDLLPKSEEEIVRRYGSSPLFKNYFNLDSAG